MFNDLIIDNYLINHSTITQLALLKIKKMKCEASPFEFDPRRTLIPTNSNPAFLLSHFAFPHLFSANCYFLEEVLLCISQTQSGGSLIYLNSSVPLVPLLEREVVEFHKVRERGAEGIKAASKLFEIFNRFVSEKR